MTKSINLLIKEMFTIIENKSYNKLQNKISNSTTTVRQQFNFSIYLYNQQNGTADEKTQDFIG